MRAGTAALLPFELYECIVSQVYALPSDGDGDWRSTLEACALVSKDFKYISYPYLFSSVTFVLVANLDDKADAKSFPDADQRRKRSFYRYVRSISEIVCYLSRSRTVSSCIRRLSLRADHPQPELDNSGIESFSYDTFTQILQPLKHLQHLSLMGVVMDMDPSDPRPILPSLQELVIDFEEAFAYASVWVTTSRLYSLCALFGEIRHLALRFIPMEGDNLAEGIAFPPVQAVTVTHCIPFETACHVLQYIPTHGLRFLHFSDILTHNAPYLSHLLGHIGPALEALTLGEVRLGAGAHWDEESPSTLTPISFNSSVNLRDIAITIEIPYEKEQYMAPGDDPGMTPLLGVHKLKATRQVALQTLPPSVKTLKLSLLRMRDRPSTPQTPAGDFWEAFGQILDQLSYGGIERVELTTIKPPVGTVSCTEGEKELLRSYFPHLVDKDMLVFP